jgi:hypothetical protein
VQDINCVAPYSLEDPKWIANHRYHSHLGALRHPRCRLGRSTDALDDVSESALDGFSDCGADDSRIVAGNSFKVSQRLP